MNYRGTSFDYIFKKNNRQNTIILEYTELDCI